MGRGPLPKSFGLFLVKMKCSWCVFGTILGNLVGSAEGARVPSVPFPYGYASELSSDQRDL